jgi:hypothetical protein
VYLWVVSTWISTGKPRTHIGRPFGYAIYQQFNPSLKSIAKHLRADSLLQWF